jgi:hypothetical protein
VALNSVIDSIHDGHAQGFAKDECGMRPEDQAVIPICMSDAREAPRLALIGDSKAQSLINGLIRTSYAGSRWMFVGGTRGDTVTVPALSNVGYARSQRAARLALETIKQNPNIDTVLIASAARELFNLRFALQLEDLPPSSLDGVALDGVSRFVGELVAAGKNVVLLVDNPTLPDPKTCISRKTSSEIIDRLLGNAQRHCSISIERHLTLSKKYRTVLEVVASRFSPAVSIIDTVETLCDTEKAICTSIKDGKLLYEYSDHISDYAAGLVGRMVNASVRQKAVRSAAER